MLNSYMLRTKDFIMTVRTTSANEEVGIPTSGNIVCTINWGDGTIESFDTSNTTSYHTYIAAGDYVVRISGEVGEIDYGNSGTNQHPIHVHNLGDLNYTSHKEMFKNCKNLVSFTTGYTKYNGNNISYMFRGCSALKYVNVKGFDIHNLEWANGVFYGCTGLETLDLSYLDFSNVKQVGYFFRDCDSLVDLTLPKHFIFTGNTDVAYYTFYNCASLTTIDTSDWDTGTVKDMRSFVSGCKELVNFDVSHFNTSSLQNLRFFANSCSKLPMLDTTSWDVSKVTDFYGFINNCHALTVLETSNWVTTSNPNCDYFAYHCENLTSRIHPPAFWENTGITSHSDAFKGAINIENYADIPTTWGGPQ